MSHTVFWLIAGIVLCLMELFLPTAFVEFMMGLSALVVAGVSLIVPYFGLQVALWMIVSLLLVLLTRRFLPKRKVYEIEGSTEAQTLTEILPGQTGRVLYEGNSWSARCAEMDMAIAPNQRVYVMRREGNILVVMPQNLLSS
ncbi:MAG: NfeD family protein [Desertifilum sp. SIO1I2]|nr:NfeD family protein [Desertifilum sp. SIO1I2]